jgi:hypothetical protein
MSYFEAALAVLRTAQRPLTTREITDRAVQRGLVTSHGKTPLNTMGAVLYRQLGANAKIIKVSDQDRAGRTRSNSVRWMLAE